LHDLLEPHVTQVLACDSRKNNLGKVGNKNDRNDARELAELLHCNKLVRVRNRLKALYRPNSDR
jgi:hypothetical protein